MERIKALWLTICVLILGIAALLNQPHPDRVNGCLWDRDTLAMEAESYPGITEIITGRFDRYPDLYYEMRLERVTQEIADAPSDLALYDDAGVASDRLERCDEAIEWMARKRAVLDTLNEPDSEHEYRYLANLGTFHIHRWLSAGADREDMQDAERARELIATAIELNPDAHFGRERYQLLAIEWILDIDSPSSTPLLFSALPDFQYTGEWHFEQYMGGQLTALGFSDAIEGLSGLIAMGNAWESIDVFRALQVAFANEQHATLVYLCMLRINELIAQGSVSVHPNFPYEMYTLDKISNPEVILSHDALRLDFYPAARDESDGWLNERNSFISEKLQSGSHPDTDPEFWTGYSESTSLIALPGDDFLSRFQSRNPFFFGFVTLLGILAIGCLGLGAAIVLLVKKLRSAPA